MNLISKTGVGIIDHNNNFYREFLTRRKTEKYEYPRIDEKHACMDFL